MEVLGFSGSRGIGSFSPTAVAEEVLPIQGFGTKFWEPGSSGVPGRLRFHELCCWNQAPGRKSLLGIPPEFISVLLAPKM